MLFTSAYHIPYNTSRIFWDTSSRKTVFNNGGYSRLIELQDGRLMAVCESDGINYAFSSNKGNTWSSPQKLVTNKNNTPNCVPDLIQLTDGTIVIAYNPRPNQPYSEDRKFGIRCKRSIDGGKTWSEEIFIYDAQHTFNDGCWEPSFLQLPSGELQLYFANEGPYTKSNEQEISMCRSFDGGLTWGEAVRVSFRAGYRDGMPSAVILQDGSSIVVAYEDNGWNGVNDFLPTTSRCPMETNWYNYWVSASSSQRAQMVDYSFSPMKKGGAPYLRKLPWGETVMSHQSATDNTSGHLNMYCYVGDENAKNFKAMSTPFITSGTDEVAWNSVAVIDTGIVVAVGGVNGHIEMIKGYPTRMLHAPYSRPKIDGILTKNEGYYQPACNQIRLGTQYGVAVFADFAYDKDSLYFICRVGDRTQIDGSSQGDAVRLLLDVADVCDTYPQAGVYSHLFRTDGKIQRWFGHNSSWRRADIDNIHSVITKKNTYYIVEAAIPWATLGCDFPPVNVKMRASIEVQDRTSSSLLTEKIPDATIDASWTWMELRLGELPSYVLEPESNASSSIIERNYWMLNGNPAPNDYSGLVILQTRYADGHISSTKQFRP